MTRVKYVVGIVSTPSYEKAQVFSALFHRPVEKIYEEETKKMSEADKSLALRRAEALKARKMV
jgi:hypothetical protein